MNKIKAVVFDLYDTLVYYPKAISPIRPLYDALGYDADQRWAARRILFTEQFGSVEEFAQRLSPGSDFDCSIIYAKLEEERLATETFPETVAVLNELRRRNIRLGLISNLSSLFKDPFYRLGLDQYFEQIIFSCDVGYVKPDPEIYQLMIDRLGIEPGQIIMAGDQVSKDVDPPRAAGMQAVHLDRSGKSPGSILSLEGIFQYL